MSARHAQNIQQEYTKLAPLYEQRHATAQEYSAAFAALQEFQKQVPKNGRILDLGCGDGRDAAWLNGQGYRLTLLDITASMLHLAQQKIPRAEIVEQDMMEMNFDREKFDGIWANASLLHLTKSEVKVLLKKLLEILKQDGKLFASFKPIEAATSLRVERGNGQDQDQRFFSLYKKEQLYQLFSESEFRNVEVKETWDNINRPWLYVFATK